MYAGKRRIYVELIIKKEFICKKSIEGRFFEKNEIKENFNYCTIFTISNS
jgi:hypothetical protein